MTEIPSINTKAKKRREPTFIRMKYKIAVFVFICLSVVYVFLQPTKKKSSHFVG